MIERVRLDVYRTNAVPQLNNLNGLPAFTHAPLTGPVYFTHNVFRPWADMGVPEESVHDERVTPSSSNVKRRSATLQQGKFGN